MEPFFIFLIIIYLAIYFSARKKARQKEQEQRAANERRYASSNRPQPNTNYRSQTPAGYPSGASRPQPAASRVQPAASRTQAQSYGIDAAHYHREGYDFETCFSFKDVPRGADELSALIAANTRHERELQKLLHTRE